MSTNLPVAAVEAAARSIHQGTDSTKAQEWESLPLEAILGFRALGRLALSAALPHLAPTPDRDTIARAVVDGHRRWVYGQVDDPKGLHEYVTGAVLTALNGGGRP